MMLSPSLKRMIDQVAQACTYMWEQGWVEGNAGNISLDVSGCVRAIPKTSRRVRTVIREPLCAGRVFLVSAAGARLRDIAQNPRGTLLLIRIAKALDNYFIIWGGVDTQSRATSEIVTHLLVHGLLLEHRRTERAIIHAHPRYTTALTHIEEFGNKERFNQLLWSIHPEIKMLLPEGVGIVPYCRPGSQKLALATREEIRQHKLIIWRKHGCLAVGEDVMSAFDLIHVVEKTAQVFCTCKSAGYEAQGLGSQDIEELKNKGEI